MSFVHKRINFYAKHHYKMVEKKISMLCYVVGNHLWNCNFGYFHVWKTYVLPISTKILWPVKGVLIRQLVNRFKGWYLRDVHKFFEMLHPLSPSSTFHATYQYCSSAKSVNSLTPSPPHCGHHKWMAPYPTQFQRFLGRFLSQIAWREPKL